MARHVPWLLVVFAVGLVSGPPPAARADVAFSPPTPVDTGTGFNPSGPVDAEATTDGGLTLAWICRNQNGPCVGAKALERSPDGTWGSIVEIGSGPTPGGAGNDAVVRPDAEGGVHVGWWRYDYDPPGSGDQREHFHAAYRPAGGSWSQSEAHAQVGGYDDEQFFAWGAGEQAFWSSYYEWVSETAIVTHPTRIEGTKGSWSAPVATEPDGYSNLYATGRDGGAVNLAGDQVMIVDAYNHPTSQTDILVLSRQGHAAWGGKLKLNPDGNPYPEAGFLDINEAGAAALIEKDPYVGYFLRVRTTATGSWSARIPLQTPTPGATGFAPSDLAIDGTGRVYIAGSSTDNNTYKGEVLEYDPATGALTTSAIDPSTQVSLIEVDEQGNAIAAWTSASQVDGNWTYEQLAATKIPGGSWSAPTKLGSDLSVLDTVIGPGGEATIVLQDCRDFHFETRPYCNLLESRATFTPSAVITSKPPERGNDPTPTFGFASTSGGASFECRTDAATFAGCTSPHTVGQLPDGAHTFAVRAQTAESAGSPATYDFTVDTTPPSATITVAPSGPEKNPSFTFTSEQGAVFECAVDAGAFKPCTSPYVAGGLTDGNHTFSVRAIDDLGNTQKDPTSAAFTVGEGGGSCVLPASRFYAGVSAGAGCVPEKPAPPAACPKGSSTTREIGNIIVAQALTKAACFRKVRGGWVSKGPVRANGVVMKFRTSRGRLTIEDVDFHLYTTPDVFVTVDQFEFRMARGIDWRFTRGQSTLTSPTIPIKDAFQLDKKSEPKAFGFKIAPSINIQLSPENGGQAKLTLALTLPDAFTLTKGTGTGKRESKKASLTVSFDATASNERAVSYGGGFTISEAYLLRWLHLFDVQVYFNPREGTFTAQASVQLPTLKPPKKPTKLKVPEDGPVLTLGIGLQKGRLKSLSLAASKINKPLAYGFFLQQLSASADNIYTTSATGDWNFSFTGGAAVSFGPEVTIPDIWEGYIGLLNGSIKLAAESLGPAVTVAGAGSFMGHQLAGGELTLQTGTGTIMFKGDITLGLAGYGAFITVPPSGWDGVSGTYAIRAASSLVLPGLGTLRGASAYLNNQGVAVCHFSGYGVMYQYATQRWQKFSRACDIGRSESALAAGARVAAGPQSFTLPRGLELASLAVKGSDAAPKITVTGPGGRTVSTPLDASGVDDKQFLLVQDTLEKTTFVVLKDPPAGKWTVAEQPGSSQVVDVSVAEGLPEPDVRGKVTGRGDKRMLVWSVTPLEGQVVTVWEESSFGTRRLAKLSGKSGRLAFTPGYGPAGKRRIVAVVEQYGGVRATIKLATYRAPGPKPLAAPKLRTKRTKSQLLASWKRVRGAREYLVVLREGGRTTAERVRKPRAKLRLGATSTATLEVYALDALGVEGKAATARVKKFKKRRR